MLTQASTVVWRTREDVRRVDEPWPLDSIGFLKEPVDVAAHDADQQVRGSIRPIQPEQRQAGRVEKGTAGIEVVSPAVGASHLFPSHVVMLRIVTGIGALELFEEAHQSASQMIGRPV
jgi:hypothetical protein